jgi:hypothetical protein
MITATFRRRRFTLIDCFALAAAAAVGSKWAYAFEQSMANFGEPNGPGVSVIFPLTTTRCIGVLAPFLVSLMLAASGLRFLQPRPSYRRLLRSSAFVICASAILGIAITAVTILLNELPRPPGQVRASLFLFRMTVRVIDYSSPVIAGACLSRALFGRWCRRHDRDWIDAFAETLAVMWVSLSLFMQINKY